MTRIQRLSPHRNYTRLLAIILFSATFFAACNDTNSVVSNTPPSTEATPATVTASPVTTATPAAAVTPTPAVAAATPTPAAATPSVSPAAASPSPAGTQTPGAAAPSPTATPQKRRVGDLTNVAQFDMPTPTPAPTPTPGPTPEVKRVNGKIVQAWQVPAEFVKLTNPVKNKPNAAKIGYRLFNQRCEGCHGTEGLGNGPMSQLKGKQATNLASEAVLANTDGELFYKVTNTDKDRLPHPKSQERFTDEERWYIVAFIRSLKPRK